MMVIAVTISEMLMKANLLPRILTASGLWHDIATGLCILLCQVFAELRNMHINV